MDFESPPRRLYLALIKMKQLLILIFLFSLSAVATGQLHTEIREEKEMGKEFHFENTEDGVLHSLDITFTGFAGTELIKGKFVYATEELETHDSDTLFFDIYCRLVADIVNIDSTGFEYNAKVCNAVRNLKEYMFELSESRMDYPSVNLTVFDPKKEETLTQIVLTRKQKE